MWRMDERSCKKHEYGNNDPVPAITAFARWSWLGFPKPLNRWIPLWVCQRKKRSLLKSWCKSVSTCCLLAGTHKNACQDCLTMVTRRQRWTVFWKVTLLSPAVLLLNNEFWRPTYRLLIMYIAQGESNLVGMCSQRNLSSCCGEKHLFSVLQIAVQFN